MNYRHGTVCCVLLVFAALGEAAEPFRFPEAKHGQGELKYINGVPVLVVAGTPEQMGEQMGVLGLKPAANAVTIFKDLLKQQKLDLVYPLLVRFGEAQLAKYPDDYRREFDAMVKASGIDREMLLIGNTFSELRHLAGCSGLMIDPGRSQTGGSLLGRNWDFPPVADMHAYNLVVVFRPEKKRAFAVVSYPGTVAAGCLMSAINADGLALGGNFIGQSADDAPQVEWKNMPGAVVARRALEECGTLAEAEKLLRANRPAERGAIVACDRSSGGVFEITSRTVALRRGKDGVCIGTNHFVSPGLAVPCECWRMNILTQAANVEKFSVADVARKMADVNQRAWTAHTLVFETKPMKLHVAFGNGVKSATTFPLKEIDLSKLLNP